MVALFWYFSSTRQVNRILSMVNVIYDRYYY